MTHREQPTALDQIAEGRWEVRTLEPPWRAEDDERDDTNESSDASRSIWSAMWGALVSYRMKHGLAYHDQSFIDIIMHWNCARLQVSPNE